MAKYEMPMIHSSSKLKNDVKTQVLHSGKERDNICVFLYGHCYQGVTGLVFLDFLHLSEVVRVYYRGRIMKMSEVKNGDSHESSGV